MSLLYQMSDYDDFTKVHRGGLYVDLATDDQPFVKIGNSGDHPWLPKFIATGSMFTTTDQTTGTIHQAVYVGPSPFMQIGDLITVLADTGSGARFETRAYRPVEM